MPPWRTSRQIRVGNERAGTVRVGGAAPVVVQTMTAGSTHRIDECVAEINKLAAAGAEMVRVAVPERKDTAALKEIINQTRVPLVATAHYHFQRTLAAVEAGRPKMRPHPSNISDRDQAHA